VAQDRQRLIVDLELARRMEAALVADVASFVTGLAPWGARAQVIAGGQAAITGPGWFANRVQGAGLNGPVSAADLDAAAAFYGPAAAVEFEVCPLAHPSLLEGLTARGYRLQGFRNVYAVRLGQRPTEADRPPGLQVAVIDTGDDEAVRRWSQLILDGFGYRDAGDRRRVDQWNRMVAGRPEARLLLATLDGAPAGAGNVLLHGATAALGGTATLPAFRRRGIQAALLQARLDVATADGATLAVVTADPGGGSARNIERAGFTLGYTNARLVRPHVR
jgi:GNAT superfamily N-acetyltransferase